jgi:hypothetical protein
MKCPCKNHILFENKYLKKLQEGILQRLKLEVAGFLDFESTVAFCTS